MPFRQKPYQISVQQGVTFPELIAIAREIVNMPITEIIHVEQIVIVSLLFDKCVV